MKRFLILLLVFHQQQPLPVKGWLHKLLKLLNESEMKSMGMKMSADDIYSINKGSLKDAVVHFGGFCTSEVISYQGFITHQSSLWIW